MLQDNKDLILKTLNAALQSKKLYPPGHPSIAAPARKIHQLLGGLLQEKPKLMIGLVDEALVFDEIPVEDGEEHYEDLYNHMSEKQVEAIIFEKGVSDKELGSLLDILADERELKGNDLQNEVRAKGVTRISLKSVQKGKKNFLEVYNDAVGVVKSVMNEIRMGKIPNSSAVNTVVDDMTELVFSDANAMIGLTMIKNYDDYLYNHSVNVGILSISLGRQMNLGKEDLHSLGVGSLLHDVGKTGVSEDIIKKPGGLSSDEWEKIKEHPVLGNKITKRMEHMDEAIGRIVFEHHIRYDRSGYPKTDQDIHPLSMIVSVADAYDALTTLRVYQQPYQPVEAIKVIRGLAGKHFEPNTVKAFEDMIGLYPVGTMVRLTTNEIGVVTEINYGAADRPKLKILYGSDGTEASEQRLINLADEDPAKLNIIGPVDPLSRNMDMASFFEKESDREAS